MHTVAKKRRSSKYTAVRLVYHGIIGADRIEGVGYNATRF
jgi:hypothetical protein